MTEGREQLDLALEALSAPRPHEGRGQDLDRDRAVGANLLGAVDRADTAASELLEQSVGADPLPDFEAQVREPGKPDCPPSLREETRTLLMNVKQVFDLDAHLRMRSEEQARALFGLHIDAALEERADIIPMVHRLQASD